MIFVQKEKKMVIVITKHGDTTRRQIIGDDLEAEERSFVLEDIQHLMHERKLL